jgi:uncharacterized protein with PQ loop repeat
MNTVKSYHTTVYGVLKERVFIVLDTLFGTIAAVLTTIRLFPQLYKTFKIKDASCLSLWYLILLFLQALFLILYGIAKSDVYIVMMNVVPILCGGLLLELKYQYSTQKK